MGKNGREGTLLSPESQLGTGWVCAKVRGQCLSGRAWDSFYSCMLSASECGALFWGPWLNGQSRWCGRCFIFVGELMSHFQVMNCAEHSGCRAEITEAPTAALSVGGTGISLCTGAALSMWQAQCSSRLWPLVYLSS